MRTVWYFLEDRAQTSFITSLVQRIAQEEGVKIQHQVRSATLGSKVLPELLNVGIWLISLL